MDHDIQTGQQLMPRFVREYGGEYENRRLQGYLDTIGRKLAARSEMPDLPYTFTIVNSPIINAFALPGGPVAISRGLMAVCNSEAELASVVGHEIGHVTARHSAERQGQAVLASLGLAVLGIATGSSPAMDLGGVAAGAFLASYSREQELEADTLGVRYMARANYDVNAASTFFHTMGEVARVEARSLGIEGDIDAYNMMASHPRNPDRVLAALRAAEGHRQADPYMGRDEYLDMIDGMLFGDDPEEGVTLGQRFIHPPLRFEYAVPPGFRIINGRERVTARNSDGAIIAFDMSRTRTLDLRRYVASEWGSGVGVVGLEALIIDGADAATGSFRARVAGELRDVRLIAIRGDRDDVFRLTFMTPPAQTVRLAEDLRRTTYSFRRLSEAEARAVQPLRVRTVRPRPEQSIHDLASGLPFGEHNADWFRALNALRPGDPLVARERLKMIT